MRLMKHLALGLILAAAYLPPACLAQPHAAVLTDTDAASLRRVEAYMNGLRTLKAHFLQIAPDGATSTGTMWLVRPGRARFEYNPPSPLLLVASHDQVVFRDNKLEQTTNTPESQTPLGLLLRDNLTLSGDVTVTEFQRPAGLLQVTLVKTKAPGDGSLTLVLDANPMALVGWSVVDAQGRETRIRLTDVTLGGQYADSLFTYVDPDAAGPNGNIP